ncbi:hypothetical protein M409DRAFT_64615 [Zasmidium cellare ATCC 36951]|uniref:AB hydrolase-1 domain-containing protein n=1 Tax=Zasmidium cellare ATCC 36951 TaxID=1080233 RepID=A0A6A6CVR9_ZASCE|nr:uncharacterized protein M409DRAFT_64615 [Zasmidium cellare ATCC 36951]KAF2170298.1 hypothetical protein M409DRAFT_64615 [Zasmidium cellare ATCC 36951]
MAGGSTFTWSHALRLDSTKSPFTSPLPQTHQAFKGVKPVSWKRYNIGGLLVTIYGQDELAQHPSEIVCMWLLHGRGDTQDSMAYTAAGLLGAWNSHRQGKGEGVKGLICICFDQRNHGSRMVENNNNISWKQGNPTHGPDMFSTYSGTAHDLSLLITQIEWYLPYKLHDHICGGVSLGGHASWIALMREPRLRASMIIVGCPDYVRLMTDRAVRSKVPSTLTTEPPGRDFLGSRDFPQALVAAVEMYDPAGILLSELDVYGPNDHEHELSEEEVGRLRPVLERTLAGKRVICLSGGKDRLVPYAQSKVFLEWLKRAIDKESGWARDQNIQLTDIVDPDAGHEFSKTMREHAERWIIDYLSSDNTTERHSKL